MGFNTPEIDELGHRTRPIQTRIRAIDIEKMPTTLKHVLDMTILGATPGRPAFVAARLDDEVAFGVFPDDGTIDKLLKFRGKMEEALYGSETVTQKELQIFGGHLGELLFAGAVGGLYAAARPYGVRLNLIINDCELQRLPWEYLHGPSEDPGPRRTRSVTRIVSAGPGPAPPPALPGRLSVLLLVSRTPEDTVVPLDDLAKAMESRFNARLETVKVDLTVRPIDSIISISRALEERKWDVVHYLGHGDVRTPADGNTVGGLILSGKGGDKFLDALTLAAMLDGNQPRLMILSACATGQAQVKSQFANLARVLVRRNVPAVVANQMVITAESIAEFCSALYKTLLDTGDIDEAVVAGRLQSYVTLVSGVDNFARVEWGVPVLYRHHSAQRLFAEALK